MKFLIEGTSKVKIHTSFPAIREALLPLEFENDDSSFSTSQRKRAWQSVPDSRQTRLPPIDQPRKPLRYQSNRWA